jgi:pilus assembly protein FimV
MKPSLRKRFSPIIITLLTFGLTLLTSANSHALGVGDIQLESSLGSPLLARVSLSNVQALNKAEIHIKQASLETYEKLGVDRSALYRTLLFDVDDNNVVTISSKEPIKEPYLHFVIQFRWPQGELYREVKLLLDPPAKLN